jgi:hypothetical protein
MTSIMAYFPIAQIAKTLLAACAAASLCAVVATLSAALFASSTATAQFVAPQHADKEFVFECAVVKVTPPGRDRNPDNRVIVKIVTNQRKMISMDVFHEMADGQVHARSEQYADTMIGESDGYWWKGWRGEQRMSGEITPGLHGWTYVEKIYRPVDGHPGHDKAVTTISTRCHPAT